MNRSIAWVVVWMCVMGGAIASASGETPAAPPDSGKQAALMDAIAKYRADLDATEKKFDKWDVGKAFDAAWKDRSVQLFTFEIVAVGDTTQDARAGQSIAYDGDTTVRKWVESKEATPLTLRSRFGTTTLSLVTKRVRRDAATKEILVSEGLNEQAMQMLAAAKAGKPGSHLLAGTYQIKSTSDARFGKPVRLGVGDAEPFAEGKIIGEFTAQRIIPREHFAELNKKVAAVEAAARAKLLKLADAIARGQRVHPELAAMESPDQARYLDALLAYDQAVRDGDAGLGDRRDAGKAFMEKWAGKTLVGFGIELTHVGALVRNQSGSMVLTAGEMTNFKVNELLMELDGRTSFGPVKMRLIFDRTKTRTSDGKVVEIFTQHEALRKQIESAKPGDRIVLDWTLGDMGDFKWGKPIDEREMDFDDRDQGEDDAGTWKNLRLIKKAAMEGP